MVEKAIEYIKNNDLKKLEALFEDGCDLKPDSEEWQLVDAVVWNASTEIRNLINDYESISESNQLFKKGYFLVRKGDNDALKTLIETNDLKTETDRNGRGLIVFAVLNNNFTALKILFERGFKYKSDWILEIAAYFSSGEIVRYLVEKINPNHQLLMSALNCAAKRGNIAGLKELLDIIPISKEQANELLFTAIDSKNIECIGCLIDKGADPNMVIDGVTPLIKAAQSANWFNSEDQTRAAEIISFLIGKGSDPDKTGDDGKKPSEHALDLDCLELGYTIRKYEKFDADEHIRKVKASGLPDAALSYLSDKKNNKVFHTEKKLDARNITLCCAEELRISKIGLSTWEYRENYSIKNDPNIMKDGYYYIPVIDMIRDCNDYSPCGLLVWIPDLKVFGSFDTEHGVGYIFKGTKWQDIIKDIHGYVNVQWGHKTPGKALDIYKYCKPWKIWDFVEELKEVIISFLYDKIL